MTVCPPIIITYSSIVFLGLISKAIHIHVNPQYIIKIEETITMPNIENKGNAKRKIEIINNNIPLKR